MVSIYVRQSGEGKGTDFKSVDIQIEQGVDFAKSQNLPYKIYNEDVSSGKTELKDRPQMIQMLQEIALKNSQISFVWAYDASRLYRNDETKIQFLSIIRKSNIRLFFKDGEFNWNDPTEKLLHNILSATNEFFVDLTSMKIKDTLRRKVMEGKNVSGKAAYGYTVDDENYLVIDEDEAKIIRKIFDMFNEGMTSHQIRNWLTDNKIPTRMNTYPGTHTYVHPTRGEKRTTKKSDAIWTNNAVLRILRNPIYKGNRRWNDEFFPAPIIIDPAHWEKTNQSYINRSKGSLRGKNTEHNYLLTPLTQCGCGKSLIGRKFEEGTYYMCAGKRYKQNKCTSRYITCDVLEDFIVGLVYGNLYDRIKEAGQNSDKQELEKALDNIRKELEGNNRKQLRLEDSFIDGTLTKEQYKRQSKRLGTATTDLKIKESNLQEQLKGQFDNLLVEMEERIIKPLKKAVGTPVTFGHDPFQPLLDKLLKAAAAKQLPFNEKRNTVHKYIKNIEIISKKELTKIEITYRIPIPNETYYMDPKNTVIVNHKGETMYVSTTHRYRPSTVDRYQNELLKSRAYKD